MLNISEQHRMPFMGQVLYKFKQPSRAIKCVNRPDMGAAPKFATPTTGLNPSTFHHKERILITQATTP